MFSPKNLRAILLDWDGTLLDSFRADSRAYLKMFRVLGVPWGLAELERHYSPDWYRVYRAAGIPRSRWEEADRIWRRYYAAEKPALLPGARRVLRWLERRYTLALVTSGDRSRVARQLRQFRLAGFFAARVCQEDAARRKPHPAPLLVAMEHLGARSEECLYVGDAPEDVEMARRVGVPVVGILGPFPTHQRLRSLRPDALLASIQELPELLTNARRD